MLLMLVELFSSPVHRSSAVAAPLRGERPPSLRVGELMFELRRESDIRVDELTFEIVCEHFVFSINTKTFRLNN